MKAQELRQKYLDFFKLKGHAIIPSASLIPDNDPTVLFTTAGMHPLVPYLMGEKHPEGKRLTSVQKCIRTGDIDEVGDNTHLTFFEMLGNWSLGDYGKKEAIEMSFEFLTQILGLDKDRLAVSVFAGDDDSPFDEESFEIWKGLGISEARIAKLPKKNNWWGPAGQTGPCGPDSEMFYWTGNLDEVPESFNDDNDLWVEIWNDVFMIYNRKKRTILVDGMHALYNKEFEINQKLFDAIENFNTRKILVVNGKSEQAKKTLDGKGYEVFSFDGEIRKDNPDFFHRLLDKYNLEPKELVYFDHSDDNVNCAKKIGIKSDVYKNDVDEIKNFINDNLYYYDSLQQKNVDTGMGLERTTAILNGLDDIYKCEHIWPLIEKIEELSGKEYVALKRQMRIIADHIRAVVMIMGDPKGIVPSNTDQGYVVRRLIRNAIRHGKQLGIENRFTAQIAELVISLMSEQYNELETNRDFILKNIDAEEEKFAKTLDKGLREFESLTAGNITGEDAFNLFATYGFPLEMTIEMADIHGFDVDVDGFWRAFKEHQKLSRTAAAGKFKGGLADDSENTKKLHTAAHLMLAALKKVLGEHVEQRGSNINPERLRFDFSHDEKMTPEQIAEVERLVNEQIDKKVPIVCEEMTLDTARESGATGIFDNKYGNKVKVYTAGDFSKEICGGPHAENTGNLGHFKITKEQSSSSGVRRIKAVLE